MVRKQDNTTAKVTQNRISLRVMESVLGESEAMAIEKVMIPRNVPALTSPILLKERSFMKSKAIATNPISIKGMMISKKGPASVRFTNNRKENTWYFFNSSSMLSGSPRMVLEILL